jgi:xylulokinase
VPPAAPGPGGGDAGAGLVLAVDLGTTALKVGVVDLTGQVLHTESADLELTLLPGGGAVQDAARWWDLVLDLGARAVATVAAEGTDPGRVVAVAVTGQWSSTVPVDADGVPVGPCILWLDSRGGRHAVRRVGGPIAGYDPRQLLAWVRRTGGAPSLDGADPLGHRWFLAAEQPQVHAAARWLLEPVDYLGLRLTGRAVASQASMVGAWLTDNRRLDPGGYDAGLVRRAGVDPAKLPPLVPTGSVVGPLRPDVAGRLGLSARVRVVAGLGDAHTTALGSGATDLFAPHLSLGTTSWVSCHVPAKKTDVVRQVAAVPSALPDRYLVLDNHETSGRCLHWLRDLVTCPERPLSYADLDALAAGAQPGSGGILFTPWLAGERTPIADRAARGGFHNLSLATTRADLVRAVLEGVAYNDRWTFDALESFTGRRLDGVRLVGGGARSDLWCQIHADVLDRTVEQVEAPEHTGLRGAAFAAGLALGALRPGELAGLVPVRATYAPAPARVAVHARLFKEFPGLYSRQKRMFARLNGAR